LSLALGALVLGSAGCYARAGVRSAVVYQEPTVVYRAPAVVYQEPTVVVAPVLLEVQTVPVEVESYPSYAYGGGSVYLVDGRWYRRSGGGWVVYRDEPHALASVRVSYQAKYGRNYRPRAKVQARPSRPGRR
jgi:hypothetical protein